MGNDLLGDRRRPTLAGGNPQLPSALKSLTSVFGMGTGVTSSQSSPDLHHLFSKTILSIARLTIITRTIFMDGSNSFIMNEISIIIDE